MIDLMQLIKDNVASIKPVEHEATPEMIEAGMSELVGYYPEDGSDREVVERVFRAMRRVEREQWEKVLTDVFGPSVDA